MGQIGEHRGIIGRPGLSANWAIAVRRPSARSSSSSVSCNSRASSHRLSLRAQLRADPYAGDFVVLDPLSDADDGRIAGVGCRLLIQTFVGFLNNPGQPGRRSQRPPLAPVREDQLDAFEVQPRFAAVLRQRLAQFRRVRRFRETRQRPKHLHLGVVQRAKLVEIKILQRPETHGFPQWRLRDEVRYARRMPQIAETRKDELQ